MRARVQTVSRLDKSERLPLLCYVTDRRVLEGAEGAEPDTFLMPKIVAEVADGLDWIQIREKDLSGKELSQITQDALQAASSAASPTARGPISSTDGPRRARILVNDRLDVALAARAGGVHLGEHSLPPQEARRLADSLGRESDFLIGVSCHSLDAARKAEEAGADYLFFGPVFATPSKAAYGAPQGLERLAEVCRAVSIPVLAIGGITLENATACISAGASGIAAIRLFQDAADLPAVIRALREISA